MSRRTSSQPDVRRNEIRRVIEGGLEDISVSRSRLPWGIPWPDNPDQTVYVWLDALTNYLSATGFPDPDYTAIWPADVHVIGKDITRFHCIYWPALLMSAGIDLPKGVWAHGFITLRRPQGLEVRTACSVELDDFIERHGAGRASATTCCAKFRGTATAISPKSGSTNATRRTWPTTSATWPTARSR